MQNQQKGRNLSLVLCGELYPSSFIVQLECVQLGKLNHTKKCLENNHIIFLISTAPITGVSTQSVTKHLFRKKNRLTAMEFEDKSLLVSWVGPGKCEPGSGVLVGAEELARPEWQH